MKTLGFKVVFPCAACMPYYRPADGTTTAACSGRWANQPRTRNWGHTNFRLAAEPASTCGLPAPKPLEKSCVSPFFGLAAPHDWGASRSGSGLKREGSPRWINAVIWRRNNRSDCALFPGGNVPLNIVVQIPMRRIVDAKRVAAYRT